MTKTLITTDSACCIPLGFFSEDIPVIQADVKTKSGSFRESREITSENVLEYAKRERKAPELVCPSVEDYEKFFSEHLKKASSICHLSCAAGIRNSYSNALKAASGLKNVFVADSKQIGGGMLLQLSQAVRLADEGFSPEFIIKSIDELNPHIIGGYVSKNASWLGYLKLVPITLSLALDFVGILPTLTVKNGSPVSGAIFKKGCEYFEGYIKKMLGKAKHLDKSIIIVSCPGPFGKTIERYRYEIEKYADFDRVVFTDIPAELTCRLGEESLGIHFLS